MDLARPRATGSRATRRGRRRLATHDDRARVRVDAARQADSERRRAAPRTALPPAPRRGRRARSRLCRWRAGRSRRRSSPTTWPARRRRRSSSASTRSSSRTRPGRWPASSSSGSASTASRCRRSRTSTTTSSSSTTRTPRTTPTCAAGRRATALLYSRPGQRHLALPAPRALRPAGAGAARRRQPHDDGRRARDARDRRRSDRGRGRDGRAAVSGRAAARRRRRAARPAPLRGCSRRTSCSSSCAGAASAAGAAGSSSSTARASPTLSATDRGTICNMVMETGATTGIFPSDEQTRALARRAGPRGRTSLELAADDGRATTTRPSRSTSASSSR